MHTSRPQDKNVVGFLKYTDTKVEKSIYIDDFFVSF